MNLQNITPKMTSDTSPAPYKVYGSSYNSVDKPYKALDANASSTSWKWKGGAKTAWIDLWFNEYTVVDYIDIICPTKSWYANRTCVYGTNDRATYDLIYDTGTYGYVNTKRIKIPRSKYKCYRLYFTGSTQGDYISTDIREIYFYKDLDISDPSEQIKSIVTDTIKNHELIKNHIPFRIQS